MLRGIPMPSLSPTAASLGAYPLALFINSKNTIFMARRDNGQILIWDNTSVNPSRTIFANLSSPASLFVTTDEQIFVGSAIFKLWCGEMDIQWNEILITDRELFPILWTLCRSEQHSLLFPIQLSSNPDNLSPKFNKREHGDRRHWFLRICCQYVE